MIEVQSLSRYYGSHRAVDDVSFTIRSNTVVGFLGLNGAGKSTTLKVLAGLLSPSAGSVKINGVEMGDAPVSFRKSIGYLPENPPLYLEMTVREYLVHLGQLRGMSGAELQERLHIVIGRCQLGGKEDQVIEELSHGYRKRVGIAQAIIHKPSLVILDEPTSGLDPVQIVQMREVITGLRSECTVLVSSHQLPEVERTCDRILVLLGGRIVADGTEDELAARLGSAKVTRFTISSPPAVAEQVLHGFAGPSKVIAKSLSNGRSTLDLDIDDSQVPVALAALVKAGVAIHRVEPAHSDLEQIFIGLNREASA
jgi:ABC-2 type transport system ATP-binding protein